ncbi:transposase [Halorussus salinus]|uniref:transposase n=1 Tax=Halorussus salinus TaxID=1364935 RepID=UPI0010928C47|nr:transposase [Halorussus salinus]
MKVAHDNNIPAPDDVFQPEKQDGESERSERRLTERKMREVWHEAKPLVMDTFHLDRGQNAQIPEGSFWEVQALAGTQQDTFTEGGVEAFRTATTRPEDQKHTGRTHRHHLQKHSVEEVRRMLRDTTTRLVQRARHNGELQGKVWAAIDVTKGNPWAGEIEWTDDNHPEDPYILGYKDDEDRSADYYFQWATIQVVGLDVPLVLDAFPLSRGTSKAEIVDELLSGGLDILPDIELVMMDREFDSEGVKNVCDDHGVYYLNPARKNTHEQVMCTKLRKAGKKVRVVKQSAFEGPSRKRLYLPARNTDIFEPSDTDDRDTSDGDSGEKSEEERREGYRQKHAQAFVETFDVDVDDEDGHMFSGVVDEVREQEAAEDDRVDDEAVEAYALFETNHPALDPEDSATEEQLLGRVRGFVERYSHRWGIENGYKQIKQFRVRTTSKDHRYRYFCFAFACVLYNVWRLVDLLVKLAFEDDPDYSPRVSAGVFLTLASQNLGLDPPD